MYRVRRAHILLCGLLSPLSIASLSRAQDRTPEAKVLPAPYQKWLHEDVLYIITDLERTEFEELKTDAQRDKFVQDFWERRNPMYGSTENPFKKEHYRRLAYVNQHFATSLPGWKTDRGRIDITYGPPDQREQHPALAGTGIPLSVRFPSDVWRYHFIDGIGKNVVFEFIDTCRCGEYRLRNDPTKKPLPLKEWLTPVSTQDHTRPIP